MTIAGARPWIDRVCLASRASWHQLDYDRPLADVIRLRNVVEFRFNNWPLRTKPAGVDCHVVLSPHVSGLHLRHGRSCPSIDRPTRARCSDGSPCADKRRHDGRFATGSPRSHKSGNATITAPAPCDGRHLRGAFWIGQRLANERTLSAGGMSLFADEAVGR